MCLIRACGTLQGDEVINKAEVYSVGQKKSRQKYLPGQFRQPLHMTPGLYTIATSLPECTQTIKAMTRRSINLLLFVFCLYFCLTPHQHL